MNADEERLRAILRELPDEDLEALGRVAVKRVESQQKNEPPSRMRPGTAAEANPHPIKEED